MPLSYIHDVRTCTSSLFSSIVVDKQAIRSTHVSTQTCISTRNFSNASMVRYCAFFVGLPGLRHLLLLTRLV